MSRELRYTINKIGKDKEKNVVFYEIMDDDDDDEEPIFFETSKNYTNLKVIGTGAYGIVISAYDTNNRRNVAIKKATVYGHGGLTARRLCRELVILRTLNHRNIIKLHRIEEINNRWSFNHCYIVTELLETNLNNLIAEKSVKNEDIPSIIYQILLSLRYIHSCGLMHRDIKPANILVNKSNGVVKICDFGLSYGPTGKFFEEESYVVTRPYRAPELLVNKRKEYGSTCAVDIWSVGCIMAELFNKKSLWLKKHYNSFSDKSFQQFMVYIPLLGYPVEEDFAPTKLKREFANLLKEKYVKNLIDFTKYFSECGASEDAIDLMKRMLTWNHRLRITAEEAFDHPFFNGVRDRNLEKSCDLSVSFAYEFDFKNENDIRGKVYELSKIFRTNDSEVFELFENLTGEEEGEGED